MTSATIGDVSRLIENFSLVNWQNTFIGTYNGVNTNNVVQIDLDLLEPNRKEKEIGGIIKIPGDTVGLWYKNGYENGNIKLGNTFVLQNKLEHIERIVTRTDCRVTSFETYLKF